MRDLRFWRWRKAQEDDVDREFGVHLALEIDEQVEAGLPPREAELAARRRLGSVALAKEELRDMRTGAALEQVGREVRHAARRLAHSPAFTLAAVLTLALAIGANASIFAVVERVVLNPLPYRDSHRLISLEYGVPFQNFSSGFQAMTWQLYHQLVDRARTLDGVAVHSTAQATLTSGGDPQRIQVTRATPSLATVLGVAPAFGRWFSEQEGVPGASPVAVLSHGLWVRRFGQDAGIVGQSVTIDGVPTMVVGVMPASFAFPSTRPAVDAWMAAQSSRASASFLYSVLGVARLRDGVTIESARAEMNTLITDLSRVAQNQRGLTSAAIPLQDAIVGRLAGTLWILLASVGLVLLVACANISNLFLVRSEARQREVAVRRALGAGRAGIARYFLAESLLLSIAGSIGGLALAWGATRLLVQFGPTSLPRLNEVRLDGVVLAFTFGLSVLTTITFGFVPMVRIAPLPVSLRESGRGNTSSRGQHHVRQLLMGGQMAIALVLVVASGLMIRSFQRIRAVDPGFDAASALTFSVGLPNQEYPTRRAAVAAHHAFIDRLSALPGVRAVSANTCPPLGSACNYGNSLFVEGRPLEPGTVPTIAMYRAVAGGYFETMGTRIIRGRGINRADVDRGEPIAVVNQALADAVFPGEDPIGRRVRSASPPPVPPAWLTIVGIAANTPTAALAEPAPPLKVYMPMSLAGGPDIPAQALVGPNVAVMTYVVRTVTPPADLTSAARAAIRASDPNVALFQIRTLQDVLDQAAAQWAFTMVLLAIAAAVGLLLAVVGIYGAMSYVVSQRTGEIGVRLALGAAPGSVSRMIVRQGGLVAVAGIAIGLAAAWAGGRFVSSLLYGVSPRDPAVFAATTVTLLGVALLACWLPARRAAKLSPLEALRTD